MKINLNQRSADELTELMQFMKVKNPTHLVQVLITQAIKSIPVVVEDNYGTRREGQTSV